jgi:hypothetical protein
MMLGERKEELDRKEQDLELCAVVLVEAQARGSILRIITTS